MTENKYLGYKARSRGGGYSGKSWMGYNQPVKSREDAIKLMNQLKKDFPKSVKDFEYIITDKFWQNTKKESLNSPHIVGE